MEYKLLSKLFYSDKKLFEETYEKRLNSESTYRFNFKIKGYNSFVVINNDILKRINKILILDKHLLRCTQSVPQIALNEYRKKCLIDEIKMTNDIEGVQSTRREINEILNDVSEKSEKKRLYGIVKKYDMLMDQSDINLKTCEDLRKLYDEFTLRDVINEKPENKPDGMIFRKEPVYICDNKQKIIHRGLNPEEDIIYTMSNCLDMLNDDKYSFLIRIAVFHYMFGYIHPFYDGNGRTSRFISSYLLSKNLEYLVSYRISYTIRGNIKKYYKSFDIVNDEKNRGDITSFVITFFDFIIESMLDLCTSLIERREKLDYYADISNITINGDANLKSIMFILIQNELFGEDGISIYTLAEASELSETTVRKLIKKLEVKELLIKSKLGNKNLYNADLEKLIKLYEEIENDK
ncbi:Fic family protein [Paraclostridium bifermentans]